MLIPVLVLTLVVGRGSELWGNSFRLPETQGVETNQRPCYLAL